MKYVTILLLTLSACGKKSNSQDSALTISAIPSRYQVLCPFVGQGWHEWKDHSITYALGYDCGLVEGKRCYYYIGKDVANPEEVPQKSEIICDEVRL